MRHRDGDRAALREFEWLLARHSSEAEFQRLFARYPQILASSLPLQLQPSNIQPLGRPGRREPDFLITPDSRGVFGYGVIELKRPDQRIFSLRSRKGLVVLSRTAATAVAQTQLYLDSAGSTLRQPLSDFNRGRTVIVGNARYAFVIMGLSDELAEVASNELLYRQTHGLLPANCQIIPYDVLCGWFRDQVGPELFVVIAAEPATGEPFLRQLDDVLYDPDYWEVSELSLEYWRQVSEQARTILSSANVPSIERDGYLIDSGPASGRLDTVTEANEDLVIKVQQLLWTLHQGLDEEYRRPSLALFLAGSELIYRSGGHRQTGGSRLSERHVGVLAKAMAYTEVHKRLDAPFESSDSDVAELVACGILRFDHWEEGASFYSIHPMFRWFGPVRWMVPNARGDGLRKDGQRKLRGSSATSTLDDNLEGVAAFAFPSASGARSFVAWIRDSYEGLEVRFEPSSRTVSVAGYAELEQFDKLVVRRVLFEHCGERVE